MAVTPDKYELPLYIAETPKELADRYHITKKAVDSAIYGNKSGRDRGAKFVKVDRI